jgi:hypothetical protein
LEPDNVRDRSSGDSVPDELRLLSDILEDDDDDLGLTFRPTRRRDAARSSSLSSATALPPTQQEKWLQDRAAMEVKKGSFLGSQELRKCECRGARVREKVKRRRGSAWPWLGVGISMAGPLYKLAGGCPRLDTAMGQNRG